MSRRGLRRLGPALAGLALAVLGTSAAAQTTYLAFGDSITEGVGDDETRAEKGYPPRLEDLLQGAGIDAEVENHGLGGESTPEALSRIDEVLRQGVSGDILLLMEGTNDISRSVSVETTRFNLNEMAKRAEARGMSVIHATTIPRLPNAKYDALNVTNTRLNQNIRDMAGRRERGLADPFEVFGTTPGLFTTYYYQGNDDPVGHPNAAGYDLLAGIFFDVIRGADRVPPVAGLIQPAHGDKGVSPSSQIVVDVWDFGEGIDLANTVLLLDGQPSGAVAVGNAAQVTFTHQPPTPLSGAVSVGLRSQDLAVPPNTVDREIARFTVAGAQALVGDLDQDGRVDGADLLRFARRFGSRFGEPLYLVDADFNEDAIIDGQDLAALAANFGKTSS